MIYNYFPVFLFYRDMIIIKNKNIENSVYIPQNIYTSNNDIYTLMLFDRGTNKEYIFSGLIDRHLINISFYTFFINFSNVPKGEYEYSIIDSNEDIVSTGLIRLNELESDISVYDDSRTYIAYDRQ